ncbi:uncharacterized protein LOC116430751 isoform X2 [Nomia melanderi]|uniref:uncharacterized protein LOC116430751 isoform X2 n=1 Tax=Nomia melanderi TaxID=2448451 RepID=UPI003FCEBB29
MKMAVLRTLMIMSLIGTEVLGYPPQERLMPDGAPVPVDAVEHEDSVASASNVDEEYDDGDDSDIYMEPDATGADPESKEEEKEEKDEKEEKEVESLEKATSETPADMTEDKDETAGPTTVKTTSSDQKAENTDETTQTEASDFENKNQRYRPNRFLGYFQRDRSGYQATATTAKDVGHPLLGSGNFGVIRGGTYYPEEKENDEYSADDASYNPYYRGRANYYRNPKPQPIRGGDFFANFRDFADITAPPKSSFSHLSVVYANHNGSATGRITEPRNIIETLKMLEEEGQTNSEAITTTEVPRKKESKGKRKLIKMRQYEEDKARRSRMSMEPLLALS